MNNVNPVLKQAGAAALRGDYAKALSIIKPALAKDRDNFDLRLQYAKFLGDWADELPPARKKKYKRESISILKPLMKQLRGKPVETRFRLPLNYYYQSEDWRGMYAFGQRFARVDKHRAIYAQGLAATSLAESVSGASSRTWAAKAVRAWKKYDFQREKYYFPHYVFAKALALSGKREDALKRLKIAARLGKRPITDWDFADVLKLC
jgi:tetratricopeptide (TPR) repeat protein